MDLDIKKAFCSPFSSEKWYIKLVFPFIISACFLIFDKNWHLNKSTQIIAIFCFTIPYLVLWGYFTQFQHNEIHNKSEILPILNNKLINYLTYGINLAGISLAYTFFSVLIFIPIIPFFIFKVNLIILTLLAIAYIFIAVFLLIALIFSECSYADNFCFKDAFRFKYIFNLMSNVKFEIFILISISILLSVILKFILMFTNIILVLYPFLRVFVKLVAYNIAAQVYKIAKRRLEIKNAIDQAI